MSKEKDFLFNRRRLRYFENTNADEESINALQDRLEFEFIKMLNNEMLSGPLELLEVCEVIECGNKKI